MSTLRGRVRDRPSASPTAAATSASLHGLPPRPVLELPSPPADLRDVLQRGNRVRALRPRERRVRNRDLSESRGHHSATPFTAHGPVYPGRNVLPGRRVRNGRPGRIERMQHELRMRSGGLFRVHANLPGRGCRNDAWRGRGRHPWLLAGPPVLAQFGLRRRIGGRRLRRVVLLRRQWRPRVHQRLLERPAI